MTQNIFPLSDNFYWLLQTVSVVLIGLTVVAGGLSIIVGKAVNRQQAERILELEKSNIAAHRELEGERRTRLEMEKSIAPRQLPFVRDGDKTNVDSLKPFSKDIGIALEVFPDGESDRAAQNLLWIAGQAGYRLQGYSQHSPVRAPLKHFYSDGVIIATFARNAIWTGTPPMDDETVKRDVDISEAAAYAFIEFLVSNGWQARLGDSSPEIPPNTIKIYVGFKPNPYFGVDDNLKQIWQKDKDQIETRRQQIREIEVKYGLTK